MPKLAVAGGGRLDGGGNDTLERFPGHRPALEQPRAPTLGDKIEILLAVHDFRDKAACDCRREYQLATAMPRQMWFRK